MTSTDIHLHLVADSAGGNLSAARHAASQAMPGALVIEHTYPPIRSLEMLTEILKQVERQPGIVLYDLGDPSMVRELIGACGTIGCHALAMPKQDAELEEAQSDPEFGSLMRLHAKAPPKTLFRLVLSVFAVALALIAIWLAVPDSIGPAVAIPPADTTEATASEISDAHLRAVIGVLRGDLWAQYAAVLAKPALGGLTPPTDEPPDSVIAGRDAVKKGAELAPHDSRIWMLLALFDAQINQYKDRVASELKMSYYTGPNDASLRSLRINLALASNAITDPDLQTLVGLELRAIVNDAPALKPSIITAYRHASPDGQKFLEAQVSTLDLSLVDAMRRPAAQTN